jgi:uncharacterized membrane protein
MKKTFSFAIVHFTIAFSLGYLVTGSAWVGGALAVLEPTLNTIAYHLHELAWQRRALRVPARPVEASYRA